MAESTDKRTATAESIANTFEWIITAFVLAFVFRAFVLEAFRIPTGSMADTLMGDHFQLRCTECGYYYQYNFLPYIHQNYRTAVGNGYYRLLPLPRCPSCGFYEDPDMTALKSNGDRILVFKCIYQFTEPKRWDVFVFKNPTGPKENYIKRLIGRPGETLEIIDGDIYIDGKLARKPAKVQQELWMPIYNNNFQPVNPSKERFNGHIWQQPFTNEADSNWKWQSSKPVEFTLQSDPEKINSMYYDTKKGNNYRAVYAYDDPRYYNLLPICSDLMMKLFAEINDKGTIGISFSKYQSLYKAKFDSTGLMVIEKTGPDGKVVELAKKQINPAGQNKVFPVSFSDADHLLVFEIGKEKLIYDLGTGKDDAGPRIIENEPNTTIFGSGKLSISDVQLYRDIHYLSSRTGSYKDIVRGGEGNPFTLGTDEYFAMGDNSPDSLDSRLWSTEGIGNDGIKYRMGIVPRDYLVGKAFFVYWPSGFRVDNFKVGLIPNVGRMRLIYGGE